jgi:ABC-type transport system involved in multi-copper enzyme maturation permease subunit
LVLRYPGGQQSSFVHAYNFAIPLLEEGLPLLMVIIGVLVGAPLVAREVEQRTQLVAWTQSIPRGRWYATKAVVLATGLGVAGLLAGFAAPRAPSIAVA